MDKLFFIDKISEPIDTVLDFGCANGILIRAMQYMFPEYSYVGYDISEDMIEKARALFPEKLAEYESIWGSIDKRFNLIHYLLKYSYTENWEREVRENYLPVTVEKLLPLIPDDYEIVYSEHYVLPYIKLKIKHDCGIVLKDATHFKVLLMKK